jgi:predicted short-subunit dehydrogenase-like oxidoreductase (DUF2520 family)
VVALLAIADELMAPAVRSRAKLRLGLTHFCIENAWNTYDLGPVRALTGPLGRGDESTVREHLRAVRRVRWGTEAYRTLGQVMLDLARKRGSIDVPTERRLRALLGGRSRKG